jgi:hypothetical protein
MISRRIASASIVMATLFRRTSRQRRLSAHLVLFLLACFAAASFANVSDAGLVGLWRFKHNNFLQGDASGNGNHATKNGAAWAFDGVRNSGVMSFDGNNDFLKAADSASLSIAGDITIAAWVNVGNTLGGGSNWRGLLAKGVGSHPASYQFFFNQGNLHPVFLRGTGSPSHTALTSSTTSIPAQNTWEHWAMTQSGTAVTFYRNGSVVHNGIINTTMADDNGPLYIGNRGDSQLDWLGRMDDVAIFSEALSPSQLADIRNGDFTEFGVPEPSTALLVAMASCLAGLARRRR